MAQPIDVHKSSPGSKGSRTQTSPISQHFKASTRSSNSLPIIRKNNDDHGNHHSKKSVFMRVKEKARKLKKSISVRRRRDENEPRYMTPPGSAGPVDDEKDRPEFFGSPLYEPTVEPEITNKGSSEKHKNTSDVDRTSTDSTDSKLSGLTISDANKTEPKSSPQPQDKGVSVKEYLMHKLEPGEDERALSQAITQTISPRCEKMKEAMSTLLGTEEPSQSTSNKTSNSELDGSKSKENTGSLADSSDPNHSVESNLSNASNINVCSTSTSGSSQNQNTASPSIGCSNLKPNSKDSSPRDSSSSPNAHVDTSANATQATTSASSHQGTKDDNR